MSAQSLEVRLKVGLDLDAEASEIDAATAGLQQELLALDVDSVNRPIGEQPPPHTKAAEIPELATLLVSLGPELVAGVASTIAGWVSRAGSRSVKLELGGDSIEVTGVNREDQRRLVESFLTRHPTSSDGPAG